MELSNGVLVPCPTQKADAVGLVVILTRPELLALHPDSGRWWPRQAVPAST